MRYLTSKKVFDTILAEHDLVIFSTISDKRMTEFAYGFNDALAPVVGRVDFRDGTDGYWINSNLVEWPKPKDLLRREKKDVPK